MLSFGKVIFNVLLICDKEFIAFQIMQGKVLVQTQLYKHLIYQYFFSALLKNRSVFLEIV